jgi:hypothetical protein
MSMTKKLTAVFNKVVAFTKEVWPQPTPYQMGAAAGLYCKGYPVLAKIVLHMPSTI